MLFRSMDIEGSERWAFNGMTETLPHLRAVSIEIHDGPSREVVRSNLAGFHTIILERPGYRPYVRFALHHPFLLAKLEFNNRFQSVRRVLRDRGEFSRSPDGFPINWLASTTP